MGKQYDGGMSRILTKSLLAMLALGTVCAQQATPPKTTAESSAYTETSRAADVARFVEACRQLPHGDRLVAGSMGRTHEDREMLLVRTALPGTNPLAHLRVVVIGNIHAGEVEGKEAAQELLRELANGEQADLLARCELWVVPIYNVDGSSRRKISIRLFAGIRARSTGRSPAAAASVSTHSASRIPHSGSRLRSVSSNLALPSDSSFALSENGP